MTRTVLREAVLSTAYLILLGLLGVSLPLALTINGLLPLSSAIFWTLVAIVVGAIIWSNRLRKLRNLKLGNKNSWFFAVGALFAIFTLGTSIVTLSNFDAKTFSHSYCIDPKNVTVTSPNCKVIETVEGDPPSQGQYVGWGNSGAFLILLGIVAVPTFITLAFVLYALSGTRPKKKE